MWVQPSCVIWGGGTDTSRSGSSSILLGYVQLIPEYYLPIWKWEHYIWKSQGFSYLFSQKRLKATIINHWPMAACISIHLTTCSHMLFAQAQNCGNIQLVFDVGCSRKLEANSKKIVEIAVKHCWLVWGGYLFHLGHHTFHMLSCS